MSRVVLAFIKNDIVMNIENINIPPNPYKCSVRRPVLSISGIDTSVITTCGGKRERTRLVDVE